MSFRAVWGSKGPLSMCLELLTVGPPTQKLQNELYKKNNTLNDRQFETSDRIELTYENDLRNIKIISISFKIK